MKNRIALAERGRQFGYKAAAVLTCAMPAAVFAQADPVTDAMTEIGTKVTTYATALVTLAIIGVGFMVGIKYIKKARGAA